MSDIAHNKVRDVYFQVFPTAKTLLETQADHTLEQSFEHILNHKVDYNAYPNARVHMDLLQNEIAQTHDINTAQNARKQLENNFVLNEMVHLSLMRSFDRQAGPFITDKGETVNGYNYNTLVFQAEALWGALNAHAGNPYAISCNAGMISIDNETSSAYMQTTANANDAIRLRTSSQKGAILTFSNLVKPDHIKNVESKVNGQSHSVVHQVKDAFIQEFTQDSPRSYNQKIAAVYSHQLDALFPETKHVNVDGVSVFNKGISSVLKDETSLMHYVFKNPEVLHSMADSFAGVKSGWNDQNEKGEYSLFFQMKKKNEIVTARDSYYSYDIDEIIAGIDQKEILPRTALYFIYNFLEVGLISLGGTAQAPYLTELKQRMLGFLDEMNQKIDKKELPPCPVSQDAIAARSAKIKEMPTTLSIGGLAVATNQHNELFSYADILSGEKMPPIDVSHITIEDAVNANMPSLITHKCMKALNTFKVGAQVISVPHISLIGEQKNDVIRHYPSRLWKNGI